MLANLILLTVVMLMQALTCTAEPDFPTTFIKVQLFWEGHKILRNLPHGFDVYVKYVIWMSKP